MLGRSGHWADANGDGVIDAADYTILRDAPDPAAASGAFERLPGYTAWAGSFGEHAPSFETFDAAIESGFAAGGAAVPEPGAAWVLVIVAVTLGRGTRRSAYRL